MNIGTITTNIIINLKKNNMETIEATELGVLTDKKFLTGLIPKG